MVAIYYSSKHQSIINCLLWDLESVTGEINFAPS